MITVIIDNPIDNTKNICFTAQYAKSRYGFSHVAETDNIKYRVHYINRTWECYLYQTVLHGCAYKWLKSQGLNPKSKRDGEKFNALYKAMTAAIDGKCK